MKRLISVVFLFMFSNSYSQNLVPNPSFEQYSSCPNTLSQINYAVPWFQPNIVNGSSTDYYHVCALLASYASVPENFAGYQNARTGVAYAGFCPLYYLQSNNTPPPGNREYLEIQLTNPLISEKKYTVSFYVSAAEKFMYATDAFGAYFSNSIVQSNNYKTLVQYQPQVMNPKGNVITDTVNWVLISGSFIANGGEQYMTIGSFIADSATTVIVNNPSSTDYGAYYYIDDVSVVEDIEDGVGETMDDGRWMMDNGIQVYPNPVCAECRGRECEVSISNELGQVVYQNKMRSDTQAFDVSFLSAGVYFVRVATREGVYNRRIIKTE